MEDYFIKLDFGTFKNKIDNRKAKEFSRGELETLSKLSNIHNRIDHCTLTLLINERLFEIHKRCDEWFLVIKHPFQDDKDAEYYRCDQFDGL